MAIGRHGTRTLDGKKKVILVTVTGFRYTQDCSDKERQALCEAMRFWVKQGRDSLIVVGPDYVRASFIGMALGIFEDNERIYEDREEKSSEE